MFRTPSDPRIRPSVTDSAISAAFPHFRADILGRHLASLECGSQIPTTVRFFSTVVVLREPGPTRPTP